MMFASQSRRVRYAYVRIISICSYMCRWVSMLVLARLALLYVVGLLLRLLLLVLVWLYHIGFNAARSCSCEGEGPERRTRTQYIRYNKFMHRCPMCN